MKQSNLSELMSIMKKLKKSNRKELIYHAFQLFQEPLHDSKDLSDPQKK